MFSVVIYPPVFRDQEAQLQLQLVAGGCRIQRRGTEWRQRRQRRRGPGGTHGPQSLLTHRFPPRRVLRRKQKKKQEVKKKMLRRLFKFSQWIVFNGSLTGRRLLDDWNCWKFSSTARFPRARNWQDFKSPARCCLLQHFCPTSNPKSNIMSTLLIWSNRLWTINVQQKSDFFFTLQVFRKNLNEEKTSCSVSTLQWNAAQ